MKKYKTKAPFKNIKYRIEIVTSDKIDIKHHDSFKDYMFKDLGYIVLYSKVQNSNSNNWHGFKTPSFIKELLGVRQWAKFCQGKRAFIIQKRLNKKNLI